jgi:hypothetical protein
MPAGTEIMIVIEKTNTMITNNACIFLLEMFLTALVKMIKCSTPFWNLQEREKGNLEGNGFLCFSLL